VLHSWGIRVLLHPNHSLSPPVSLLSRSAPPNSPPEPRAVAFLCWRSRSIVEGRRRAAWPRPPRSSPAARFGSRRRGGPPIHSPHRSQTCHRGSSRSLNEKHHVPAKQHLAHLRAHLLLLHLESPASTCTPMLRAPTSSRRSSPTRTRLQAQLHSRRPRRQPLSYGPLPGPTTSVGTRTDYSVGPCDYLASATRHLLAWGARTTVEMYSDRKLYMSCTM
jgi:hypothetical protein